MDKMEDLLVHVLETDIQAILAFVYIGNNQKVWYWYTRNKDETIRRINDALREMEKLPIEIFLTFDPDWDEYNSIID
jgi:hypothetical protein